jgi:4-amino-4-deoxy-L-arabinose transferase-like glycosyltransferase
MTDRLSRWWWPGLAIVMLVYLHDAFPYLTTMPRVNVDEPWLIERAYQVLRTGVPSQPMLGLRTAYFLQIGYGYLLAPWFAVAGVGLFQARLFAVLLGAGIVLMAAWIGRRLVDTATGLWAALLLSTDSNFLGGVRNARTDIPSVFFVTAALATYTAGRRQSRASWFAASGACAGLAMLCHGNAFWVLPILLAWCLIDYGRRAPTVRFGYAFLGGLLLTFGPYLAVVALRWADVQQQIANFAGDRVPGWRPSFVLHQMALEMDRYRTWYFGLVTNTVPNPLLLAFRVATVVGVAALIVRLLRPPSDGDWRAAARVLTLTAGAAFIFAAFINNKVPVYLPHLLLGFALAAGVAAGEVARWGRHWAAAVLAGFVLYSAAGVAYYEKWYSTARKSELVSYEKTTAMLRELVPAGPRYIYGSPQFWTPFHDEAATSFFSYAAAQPIEHDASVALEGAAGDRALYLVVDEFQWLPELTTAVSQQTTGWQSDWIRFIERRCALEAEALGTAHGTVALYRCALSGPAPHRDGAVRIVGDAVEYAVGDRIVNQSASDLSRWTKNEDPRRTASQTPDVHLEDDTLRIAGSGYPGIVKMLPTEPGGAYLVRARTAGTQPGDLLYLGTWQQPQVRSLAGASSAGIPAALVPQPWFPHDRAFVATASAVRVLIYSEAPQTRFAVSSLDVYRLLPAITRPAP